MISFLFFTICSRKTSSASLPRLNPSSTPRLCLGSIPAASPWHSHFPPTSCFFQPRTILLSLVSKGLHFNPDNIISIILIIIKLGGWFLPVVFFWMYFLSFTNEFYSHIRVTQIWTHIQIQTLIVISYVFFGDQFTVHESLFPILKSINNTVNMPYRLSLLSYALMFDL